MGAAVPQATSPAATIGSLRAEAAVCKRCELYREATQTVFGEGPVRAELMLVGEQPGDREDRAGHPFVGPAGRILDDALARAAIDRADVYVTNAVKHFHNEPRGKRRIHKKPGLTHVRACAPWLSAEIAVVGPRLLVALGATAAHALLGPGVRVTSDRGHVFPNETGVPTLVTVHPSSILRVRSDLERAEQVAALVDDLTVARRAVHERRISR
jgi:DNA polymerase